MMAHWPDRKSATNILTATTDKSCNPGTAHVRAVSLTSAHKDTSSYPPRTTELDEVCTILASGKNVATMASLPLVRSLIGFGNA
jgi:hypothetical protein